MRVALIGQKGFPAIIGGVESHVEQLALGLVKKKHDVFVYCRPWYNKKKIAKSQGVNLIYKWSWNRKNWDTITHVWFSTWHAIFQDYDIIHYHGVGPALLSWIPRIFNTKTKVIVTFHSIDRFHQKWGLFARLMLRLGEYCAVHCPHQTIVVSKTLHKYCLQKFNIDTVYIPNGVDAYDYYPPKLIKHYRLDRVRYIFLITRLIPHKGVHYLIEAFKSIRDENLKLVIAGGGSHTDKYFEQIKKMALTDERIVFTGPIPLKSEWWYELFSNAYLFAYPSEHEGLPIVLLEAMAFGQCVLASDIPENMELVTHGVGFTFKNKDVSNLRLQLRYLLDHPEVVAQVGAAARNIIVNKYDWKKVITAIDFVYHVAAEKDVEEHYERVLGF